MNFRLPTAVKRTALVAVLAPALLIAVGMATTSFGGVALAQGTTTSKPPVTPPERAKALAPGQCQPGFVKASNGRCKKPPKSAN